MEKMSTEKPRSKTRRPSWFQDTKSGCEKQTDYFLKIRKLQKELINREQHNLVNAMERLKQLQYPRRKPVVRNFSLPDKASSAAFPKRPFARRGLQRNQTKDMGKDIRPLKGKHLLPDENMDLDGEDEVVSFTLEDIRHIYNRMVPKLNDQQIAKIANEVRSTFPNEPSTYLLQPHLPSIPNVKRKTTTRLVNRLKLLTLSEESEYKTLNVPKIATSLRLQKKQNSSDSPLPEISKETKPQNVNKPKNILYFDIDPNDTSVFVHTASEGVTDNDVDDFNDDDDDKDNNASPFPPPNSRPNSHVATSDGNVDSKNDPIIVADTGVTLEDNKVEENSAKNDNFTGTADALVQEDCNTEPQDAIPNTMDEVSHEDVPLESHPTEDVNQNDTNDEENQLPVEDTVCISEPKVIIKTSKTQENDDL